MKRLCAFVILLLVVVVGALGCGRSAQKAVLGSTQREVVKAYGKGNVTNASSVATVAEYKSFTVFYNGEGQVVFACDNGPVQKKNSVMYRFLPKDAKAVADVSGLRDVPNFKCYYSKILAKKMPPMREHVTVTKCNVITAYKQQGEKRCSFVLWLYDYERALLDRGLAEYSRKAQL